MNKHIKCKYLATYPSEWPRSYLVHRNLHIAILHYMGILLADPDCQAMGANLLITLCEDRYDVIVFSTL